MGQRTTFPNLQLIRTGFSSSTKMNFFAILVFAGIVACVVCEEAKKEDVQKAAKKEDLKSDMKTKLKNLAMKSKQAKDYKRQNYYHGTTWSRYETTPYPYEYGTTGGHRYPTSYDPWGPTSGPTWYPYPTTSGHSSLEEYEDQEEESEKMEDFHEGEYPGKKKSH